MRALKSWEDIASREYALCALVYSFLIKFPFSVGDPIERFRNSVGIDGWIDPLDTYCVRFIFRYRSRRRSSSLSASALHERPQRRTEQLQNATSSKRVKTEQIRNQAR